MNYSPDEYEYYLFDYSSSSSNVLSARTRIHCKCSLGRFGRWFRTMISYNEKRVQGRSGPNSLGSIGSIFLLLVFSAFLCSISAILFWLLATERIGAATRQLHFPLIRANRQRRSRTCQKFTADRYLYKLMIINDHRRIINTIEIWKLAAYCCKRRSFSLFLRPVQFMENRK